MSVQSNPDVIERLLRDFAKRATPEQDEQLSEALMTSPMLAARLSLLASNGRFFGFFFQAGAGNPFAATIDRGKILLTPSFLANSAPRRVYDVRGSPDLLTNNLVFVLGALTFYLEQPGSTATRDKASFVEAGMDMHARSLIHGWNCVVDSAIHQNGGQLLNDTQRRPLFLDLRYRQVFLGGGKGELSFLPSGQFEVNEENVATVAAILGSTSLLDFGVTPHFEAVLTAEGAGTRSVEAEPESRAVTIDTRVGQTKDGKDAVSISIGRESITLNAAQLLMLTQQLVAHRANMKPPAAYQAPKPGETMSVILNPATSVSSSFTGTSILVSLQHPGLGRISYEFSGESANEFHKAIGKHVLDLGTSNPSERH